MAGMAGGVSMGVGMRSPFRITRFDGISLIRASKAGRICRQSYCSIIKPEQSNTQENQGDPADTGNASNAVPGSIRSVALLLRCESCLHVVLFCLSDADVPCRSGFLGPLRRGATRRAGGLRLPSVGVHHAVEDVCVPVVPVVGTGDRPPRRRSQSCPRLRAVVACDDGGRLTWGCQLKTTTT